MFTFEQIFTVKKTTRDSRTKTGFKVVVLFVGNRAQCEAKKKALQFRELIDGNGLNCIDRPMYFVSTATNGGSYMVNPKTMEPLTSLDQLN